jgi:hypothetical protein
MGNAKREPAKSAINASNVSFAMTDRVSRDFAKTEPVKIAMVHARRVVRFTEKIVNLIACNINTVTVLHRFVLER